MSIDSLVIWLCSVGAAFLIGMYVGQSRPPEVRPCQKEMTRSERFPGIKPGEELGAYFKREGVMK
jgi:hypothetical protein